jgi:predicted membrane channel-forming protein YqfA (hemolysin III family)
MKNYINQIEILFFIILGAMGVLSYYELFDDDRR